jgi:hypothetical protein
VFKGSCSSFEVKFSAQWISVYGRNNFLKKIGYRYCIGIVISTGSLLNRNVLFCVLISFRIQARTVKVAKNLDFGQLGVEEKVSHPFVLLYNHSFQSSRLFLTVPVPAHGVQIMAPYLLKNY